MMSNFALDHSDRLVVDNNGEQYTIIGWACDLPMVLPVIVTDEGRAIAIRATGKWTNYRLVRRPVDA